MILSLKFQKYCLLGIVDVEHIYSLDLLHLTWITAIQLRSAGEGHFMYC